MRKKEAVSSGFNVVFFFFFPFLGDLQEGKRGRLGRRSKMSHISQDQRGSCVGNLSARRSAHRDHESPQSTVLSSSFTSHEGRSSVCHLCSLVCRLLSEGCVELLRDKCSLGFRWGWPSSLPLPREDSVVVEGEPREFRNTAIRGGSEIKFGLPSVGTRKSTVGRARRDASPPYLHDCVSLQELTVLQNGNAVYASCCWLRGVVGYISCVIYLISLWPFFSQYPVAAFAARSVVCLLSEASCVFIGKYYMIIWEYEASRHSFFERVPFLFSPWVIPFLAEVVFWQISTPPFLVFIPKQFIRIRSILESLDYVLFIRLYAIVLYYRYVSLSPHSLCCLLSHVGRSSGEKINTFFFVRSALYNCRGVVLPLLCTWWWLTIGFLYCKSGLSSGSLENGLWLSFQTLSSLSYGDVASSSTVYNQWVLWLAWLGSAIIRGYLLVVLMWFPLMVSNRNHPYGVTFRGVKVCRREDCVHNVEVLSECYLVARLVQDDSVKVIQAAWRLHRARRRGGEKLQPQRRRGREVGLSPMSWSDEQRTASSWEIGKYRMLETVLALKVAHHLRNLRMHRSVLLKATKQLTLPIKSVVGESKKMKFRERENLQRSLSVPPCSSGSANRDSYPLASLGEQAAEATSHLHDALVEVRKALNAEETESGIKRKLEAVESSLLCIISKKEERASLTPVSTPRFALPEHSSPIYGEEGSSLSVCGSVASRNGVSQSLGKSMTSIKQKAEEIQRLIRSLRDRDKH